MQPSLPGPAPRAALVTGAGRRIGRAIALRLAEVGWSVAVHYGQSSDEAEDTVAGVRARGGRAVALPADLADEAAVAGLVDPARGAVGAEGGGAACGVRGGP